MIEVINYQRENRNKVIGYVDIKLWDKIVVRRIAHLQSGDRRWFNLATFPRKKEDGTSDYKKYFEFSTEVHNSQLLDSLSEKVKEFCEKHNIPEIEPLSFTTAFDINF